MTGRAARWLRSTASFLFAIGLIACADEDERSRGAGAPCTRDVAGCVDAARPEAAAPDGTAPDGEVPRACDDDGDCGTGELCAVDGVAELSLEAGDEARCTAVGDVIGGSPSAWPWRGGGRPLAARLCTAQGLSSGAGAEADARRGRQRMLLEGAGVGTVRLGIRWSRVEARRGQLDLSRYDPMIDAAVASGLDVIGLIAYGAPWASSLTEDDDKYPPDDPADYAAYAGAVAEHYAGRVHRFELWNEPNAGYRFFKPTLHGDAARFADMLAAGAQAIHGGCPSCIVYSGGLFFHQQLINGAVEFTQDVLTARPDAFDGIDGFGLHPYPRYPPARGPEEDDGGERALGGMVADLRAVLEAHGAAGDLPFAVTEVGWPSYGTVSERLQAAFLSRAVVLGTALGLDPICWFNVVDGPNHGTFPPEDDFGLYRHGSDDPAGTVEPKPARDAIRWLATVGRDATPKGPSTDSSLHDPESGRFAIDLSTPAGVVTALWSSRGDVPTRLEPETRTAYGFLGDRLAQPEGGVLDITVGEEPVFLLP